jgi:hypothetical protein
MEKRKFSSFSLAKLNKTWLIKRGKKKIYGNGFHSKSNCLGIVWEKTLFPSHIIIFTEPSKLQTEKIGIINFLLNPLMPALCVHPAFKVIYLKHDIYLSVLVFPLTIIYLFQTIIQPYQFNSLISFQFLNKICFISKVFFLSFLDLIYTSGFSFGKFN